MFDGLVITRIIGHLVHHTSGSFRTLSVGYSHAKHSDRPILHMSWWERFSDLRNSVSAPLTACFASLNLKIQSRNFTHSKSCKLVKLEMWLYVFSLRLIRHLKTRTKNHSNMLIRNAILYLYHQRLSSYLSIQSVLSRIKASSRRYKWKCHFFDSPTHPTLPQIHVIS